MKRKDLGALGEKLAKDYLKKQGYRLRETNFRCSEGEIDIVAEKGDYLVIVEVRTKSSTAFGSPEESLTASKKQRLITLAMAYRDSHQNLPTDWRIDVVAVELEPDGRLKRLEHIENAVEGKSY